nr:(d)CMP kinase [Gilvimarinus xylanilyticus]
MVTIDGPSGAGKGTLSQLLAKALGASLLDSGALYRLVALSSLKRGIAADDVVSLSETARQLDVVFRPEEGTTMLEGEDVTQAIRAETVSMLASQVAALQPVRDALLERQRQFSKGQSLVADGRDMGTTVFPEADVKFFLTASSEARAQRRYKQLLERGEEVDLQQLIADIEDRDLRDRSRAVSPLRPAPDAIEIDSTNLTIPQVLELMLSHASNH